MKNENIRIWVLASISLTAVGCSVENKEHCWLAAGDQTCGDLLGGGFCSDDRPECEGYGVPYGCVFQRPKDDACYSPQGDGTSCEGPNAPTICTELAEASGGSGTSESADATDTSEAFCGDGTRDADEECDDGNANNHDDCTNACTTAVCGDMIIHANFEDCDDGNTDNTDECTNYCARPICGDMLVEGPEECDDGNKDNGDHCTNVCKIAVCGDSFVQPGEICDDGNQNVSDYCAACQLNGKYVFITSTKYTGDLDGLAGADAICNVRAEIANLPGYYMAWISTNFMGQTPYERFTKSAKPYYLVNFTKVADDWVDLTDGTLDAPIDRTEMDSDPPTTALECANTFRTVRTGTGSDGTLQGPACANFSNGSIGMMGIIGSTFSVNNSWTACDPTVDQLCSIEMPIYCFQQ